MGSLTIYYLPMLIFVFPQDSYPNPPNQRHLRKLPQNLVPTPWALRCELSFILDAFSTDITGSQSIAVAGSVIVYLFLKSIVCVLSKHLYPTGFGSQNAADGPPPVPSLPGCYLAGYSLIIFYNFLMLLLFELGRSLILGNPGCMIQTLLEQLLSF